MSALAREQQMHLVASDEELAAVGVNARIRLQTRVTCELYRLAEPAHHGDETSLLVLQLVVFVFEFVAIDGNRSSTITLQRKRVRLQFPTRHEP